MNAASSYSFRSRTKIKKWKHRNNDTNKFFFHDTKCQVKRWPDSPSSPAFQPLSNSMRKTKSEKKTFHGREAQRNKKKIESKRFILLWINTHFEGINFVSSLVEFINIHLGISCQKMMNTREKKKNANTKKKYIIHLLSSPAAVGIASPSPAAVGIASRATIANITSVKRMKNCTNYSITNSKMRQIRKCATVVRMKIYVMRGTH